MWGCRRENRGGTRRCILYLNKTRLGGEAKEEELPVGEVVVSLIFASRIVARRRHPSDSVHLEIEPVGT